VEYQGSALAQTESGDLNIFGDNRLESGIAPYASITHEVVERFASLTPEHGSQNIASNIDKQISDDELALLKDHFQIDAKTL
jgi:hypothetical protein